MGRHSVVEERMTLPEALAAAAAVYGDRTSFVCDDTRLTLGEIRTRALALAGVLAGQGIGSGDRVALLAPNGPAYVDGLFAAAHVGAVIVPLDVRLHRAELERLVEATGASAALVDVRADGAGEGPSAFVEEAFKADRTIRLGPDGSVLDRDAPAEPPAAPVTISPSDVAMIFSTSGATGAAKLVSHTHAGLCASIASLHSLHRLFFKGSVLTRLQTAAGVVRNSGLRLRNALGQQVWMTPIAMSSISGHEVLLGSLLGGHRLVTTRTFHPRRTLEVIGRERVNIVAGTPVMAELLLEATRSRRYDFSSLLLIGLGGGPVTPELAAELQQAFGCPVTIGYGSTELGGGALVNRISDSRHVRTRTVGRPVPAVEARVVDDTGAEVAVGEVGELWCRSPATAHAPGAADDDGWVRTADLAVREPSGSFRIVGRKDDMIIRGGWKIAPAEVEQVIARVPGVARCAVVGVDAALGGQEVWAFVEAGDGADAAGLDTAVVAACRASLSAHKQPARVVVGPVPTTPEGKIQRFKLRQSATTADAQP